MKRIVLVLIGMLALHCLTHAAGFDCARAKISVEKMICADAELSKLDEDLAAVYTKAMKSDGGADSVRQKQKQWLKERNACVDTACVKNAYQSRITVVAQGAQAAASGIDALYGTWEAGGSAGIATYGTMEISKLKISWKGRNRVDPRCTVTYEQVAEGYGTKFKDKFDRIHVIAADSPFRSFLLAIHGECALGVTHLRLTLPNDIRDYLEMIEYRNGANGARGYSHFHKR